MPEAMTESEFMPPEGYVPPKSPVPGWAPEVGFLHWLHRQELRMSPAALRDALQADEADLEGLAALARSRGTDCRLAQTRPEDLRHLSLPAVVEMVDGGCLLLVGQRKGHLVLEGPEGTAELPEGTPGAFTGRALGAMAALPKGKGLWDRLGKLVLQHRPALVPIALTSLGLQGLNLLGPQLTRIAMDNSLTQGAYSLLNLVVIGMILSAVFQAWTGWTREQAIIYLETRLETGTERSFLTHLLNLPFSVLHRRSQSDLLQAVSGLEAARNLLSQRFLGAVFDGASMVTYLVAMALAFPSLTGVITIIALVVALGMILVGQLQVRQQRLEVKAQTAKRGFLLELLSGVATVKAAGAEASAFQRWMGHLREELEASLRRQRLGLWSDVGLETARQAISALILIWGGLSVLRGEAQLGSLMSFTLMTNGFLGAAINLTQAYLQFIVTLPQLEHTKDLLAVEAEAPAVLTRKAGLTGPVVLEDVWFRYAEDGPWVLQAHSMRVNPGEKHWLRGPSGSGKSSVLRLVAGLYEPEQGRVSLGGLDPRTAGNTLIYLPQFVHLYGGTLLENLRILSGGMPRARLMEAAEASGLEQLVAKLPMGYNTILPPGGATLSGGQRQLVALTAVMASDRQLLLLDEAMANLDWVNRAWISNSPWFQDKTVIYASHDAGFGLAS